MQRIFLTDAGAAAYASGELLTILSISVGTGFGPGTPADAGPRVALRAETAKVAATVSAAVDERRLVAATIPAGAAVTFTEMAVWMRKGAAGAPFIAFYGSRPGTDVDDVPFGARTPVLEFFATATIDVKGATGGTAGTVSPTLSLTAVPDATRTVAGKNRHATDTEMDALSETKSPEGVVPDLRGLARVLGLMAVTSIAASQTITWNKPFSKALVILAGGSGGGGGALTGTPPNPVDGGDGGDSTLTVSQMTYTAKGGQGGDSGNSFNATEKFHRHFFHDDDLGGGVGGRNASAITLGQTGMRQGGYGVRGEVKVIELSDLTADTDLAFVIGAGGSATDTGLQTGDTQPVAGSPGWAKIIPLPDTA